jgi:phage shock protein C
MRNYKNRPTKLYKNPREGKCMGVCAGIADYLDIKVGVVRILMVLGFFVVGPFIFIAYFITGMVLDARPLDLYEDDHEEEFWKQTRKAPEYTAAELRGRFRDIERRTADMEAYMTSKRFKLERDLRALED